MRFEKFNPSVISAGIYEGPQKRGACISYCEKLVYVFSGGITVKTGERDTYKLSAGQTLFIPAGVVYQMKADTVRMALITFASGEIPEIKEPVEKSAFDFSRLPTDRCDVLNRVLDCQDMESERDAIKKICDLFTTEEGEYLAFASAYLKILLLKLFEASEENALPTRMVEALGEYVKENIQDGVSNTELGAIFGYHPFYISRMLKEKKGLTMKQYVIQYRLKLAKRLLELTAKTVGEIAEEAGFTDASYFTKSFREAYGITPKEYRSSFSLGFI